jgi:hypothetical protein
MIINEGWYDAPLRKRRRRCICRQPTYQGETKDGQQFSGGSPIVTVVEVKGGKVTRHSDYFDYKQNAVEFSK